MWKVTVTSPEGYSSFGFGIEIWAARRKAMIRFVTEFGWTWREVNRRCTIEEQQASEAEIAEYDLKGGA